jgi:hypothetical protein
VERVDKISLPKHTPSLLVISFTVHGLKYVAYSYIDSPFLCNHLFLFFMARAIVESVAIGRVKFLERNRVYRIELSRQKAKDIGRNRARMGIKKKALKRQKNYNKMLISQNKDQERKERDFIQPSDPR